MKEKYLYLTIFLSFLFVWVPDVYALSDPYCYFDPTTASFVKDDATYSLEDYVQTDSDGAKTYTYYSDQSYSTVVKDKPTSKGIYYVKVSIAQSSYYNAVESSNILTLNITNPIPTVSFQNTSYSITYGDAPLAITATTTNDDAGATVSLAYYTDKACTTGETSEQPTAAGSYWVKATSAKTTNYEAASAITTFVINKAAVNVTFDQTSYTKTYGEAAVTITANTDNTETGATVSLAYYTDEACTTGETSEQPTTAGSYWVKATSAATANYAEGSAITTFVINKAAVNVTFDQTSYTKTYGEAAVTITANTNNPETGATVSLAYYTDEACTTGETSEQPTAAGSYWVKATSAATSNYAEASAITTFVINKAAVNVTFDQTSYTKTYGESAVTITASTDNPETGATVSLAYYTDEACTTGETSEQPTTAGSYWVKATSAATSNYAEASATTTFIINKTNAEVSFQNTPYEITYGDAPLTITATSTNTDAEASVSLAYYTDEACTEGETSEQPTTAGSYWVKATSAETTNFEEASATTTFIINKTNAEVSFQNTPYEISYGEEALAITATTTNTDADASVSIAYYTDEACTTGETAEQPTAVGSYWVKATSAETANFEEASATTTFMVNKAVPVVTFQNTPYSITYGDEALAITATTTNTDADASVSLAYYTDEACTTGETTEQPTTAGSYWIKATSAATANFEEASATTTFVISKAAGTISFGETEYTTTYGTAATISVTTPSDGEVSYRYYTNEVCTEGETTEQPVCVGEYWVKAAVAEGTNYLAAETADPVKLTISENEELIFDFSAAASEYCAGTGGVSLVLSGSSTAATYSLQTTDGTEISGMTGTGSSLEFTAVSAGSYKLIAIYADGCTSDMTTADGTGLITITENPLPDLYELITPEVSSYCPDGTGVMLQLLGSQAGVSYTVYEAGGTAGTAVAGAGTADTLDLGYYTAGIYTVEAADDATGCKQTMTGEVELSVLAAPQVYTLEMVDSLEYCAVDRGVNLRLNGSEIGVTYYLYNDEDIDEETGEYTQHRDSVSGTGEAIVFKKTTFGNVIAIAVHDETLCEVQMDGQLEVVLIPNTPTPTVLSYDECIDEDKPTLNLRTLVTSDDTYLKFYDTAGNEIDSIFDISVPWTDTRVYVTNTIDPYCESNRATITIFVEGFIEAELESSRSKLTVGNSVTLSAIVSDGIVSDYTWYADGTELDEKSENLTDSPSSDTTYKLTLTGRCNITDLVETVFVRWQTAITPYDENGKNDSFARGWTIVIYNRYGEKVFEGDDGWDGSVQGNFVRQGSLATPGTYYYVAKSADGSLSKSGTIEVVKR